MSLQRATRYDDLAQAADIAPAGRRLLAGLAPDLSETAVRRAQRPGRWAAEADVAAVAAWEPGPMPAKRRSIAREAP